jgi:heptosyltransferase II
MSFPFADALAQQQPNERIIAVVEPVLSPLIKKLNSSFIIWEYKKNQRTELLKALKAESPERCYLLTNSFGSYLPYLRAGVPKRIGHGGKFTRFLLTDSRYYPDKSIAQGVRNCSLLEDKAYQPLKKIVSLKIDASKKTHLIVFPGAKYGPAKKWSAEAYASVIDRAIEKEWKVSLLGTNEEIADAEAILKTTVSKSKINNLCGSMNLGQLLGFLESSENCIALANDSGAFHLLSACGVPSLGLYFSTSSTATPPAFGPFEAMNADIDCKPCFARECPLKHYQCRDSITAQAVMENLIAMEKAHFNNA